MPLPIAVLVSGGGSNMTAIADRIEEGSLDASIAVVIADHARAAALDKAAERGLPSRVVDFASFAAREDFDRALLDAIGESGAQTVVLAGFMRLLGPGLLGAFPQRILNIHPALLPSFPGLRGQRQAAEYGARIAGCTVHFVDEGVDTGPVIIQAALAVAPGERHDTLAERILRLEHRVYPQAIQWLAAGRLTVRGRHVFLRDDHRAVDPPIDCDFIASPPLEAGF